MIKIQRPRVLFAAFSASLVLNLGLFSDSLGADQLRIGVVTGAFGKGESKTFPGGGSQASDLTEKEVSDVLAELNHCLDMAVGDGKVVLVPMGPDPLEYKLFISGATRHSRGQTAGANHEAFVYEGTLQNEVTKADRKKLLNSVIHTAKHELVHLIGGLEDSDHNCKASQAGKDKVIGEMQIIILDLKDKIDGAATEKERKRYQSGFERAVNKLTKYEGIVPSAPDAFTAGEKITNEEHADSATATYDEAATKALKAGVQKILNGHAPRDNPGEHKEEGFLAPVRGVDAGRPSILESQIDFEYTLQSAALGGDLSVPDLQLGLIDDSGEFVPFHFEPRPDASADLLGMMTLEAGHPYDFVLYSRSENQYVHASDPETVIHFDPDFQFDSALAEPFDLALSGDYFGLVSLDFRFPGVAGLHAKVMIEPESSPGFLGNELVWDGFIDPLNVQRGTRSLPDASGSLGLFSIALASLLLHRASGQHAKGVSG